MESGVQREFQAHGIKGETGHITFSPNSQTVQVPVGFKTCFMGMGQMATGDSLYSLICTCDNKVIDGKVTFTRHGSYFGDSPVMNYIIFGW